MDIMVAPKEEGKTKNRRAGLRLEKSMDEDQSVLSGQQARFKEPRRG